MGDGKVFEMGYGVHHWPGKEPQELASNAIEERFDPRNSRLVFEGAGSQRLREHSESLSGHKEKGVVAIPGLHLGKAGKSRS